MRDQMAPQASDRARRPSFLEGLPPAQVKRWSSVSSLEDELEGFCRRARERYRDIGISDTELVRHLASHLPAPSGDISAHRAEDLLVALGCARANSAALRHFEADFLPAVDSICGTKRNEPVTPDELRQCVRERLLVAAPGRAPGIASYAARGTLRGFLCMVAGRLRQDLLRAQGPWALHPPAPSVEPLEGPLTGSPELAHLKAAYQREFKASFEATLAQLTPEERNLLRRDLLLRWTAAQIAQAHGVHRVTVARWLSDIRERLIRGTRRELAQRLSLSSETAAPLSVAALVRSELDVSLERCLRTHPDEEPAG